jgi:ADP-heptose:LPS heptosyltransferase
MKSIGAIETLLVARPDRVGDVILSSSCLPAVRAHFPQAALHWMVAERMHPLFHAHPLLEGLMGTGEGTRWQRVRQLARTLRALRPDALVLLQPDRAIELGSRFAGVPVRAGFARPRCWPQFLTHATPYRKNEGMKHEAANNFEVLALLGVPTPVEFKPSLSPDPAARERLALRLGANAAGLARCAALHLAAHGAKPRVPLENFAALAGWLKHTHGLRTILIGTETEPAAARLRELAGLAATDLLDLRGPADLAETAWLLREAAFCAARDTGPAHLAAAEGCPTLVFFLDVRPLMGPRRWTPLGPRVEVLTPGPGGFGLAAMQSAAAKLLARGRAG